MNITTNIFGNEQQIKIQFSRYIQTGFTTLNILTEDDTILTSYNNKDAVIPNSDYMLVRPECVTLLTRLGIIEQREHSSFMDRPNLMIVPIYRLTNLAIQIKNQEINKQEAHAFALDLA